MWCALWFLSLCLCTLCLTLLLLLWLHPLLILLSYDLLLVVFVRRNRIRHIIG